MINDTPTPLTHGLTANRPRFLMVFDVESIGLHGEGFAVSWLVVDTHQGIWIDEQTHACNPSLASGTDADRLWVANNVPTIGANCASPAEVRSVFWHAWLRWREQSAWLAADAAWPVETNFLSACIRDVGSDAHFLGPYPLIDIDALAVATGHLRHAELARKADELPVHDPAADARFSARRLMTLLAAITPFPASSASA